MSDTLNIAVNALNKSAVRIANTASSIVKASSTSSKGDLSSGLVSLIQEKTSYAADAKVVHVADQTNKKLLDILA